jgi:strawberry notch-like protein/NTP hydrolase family protein/inorganic pyrophosphatase-like protein/ADP-ribosyltransferase-like protein
MSLEDAFGQGQSLGINPTEYVNQLIDWQAKAHPDLAANRLDRKGLQPQQQPGQQGQDFSSFGEPAEQATGTAPPGGGADFSSFGDPVDEQGKPVEKPPEGKGALATVGGGLSVLGREAGQTLETTAGHAAELAGRAAPQESTLTGRLGMMAPKSKPSPSMGEVAGKALLENAPKTFPVTEQERAEHPYYSAGGQFIGGAVPMGAAALLGGAPAVAMGAAYYGIAGAGAAYDTAIEKGATDGQALLVSGATGAVTAAIGGLNLGVILAPIRQVAPGVAGWAVGKLAQAGLSGLTFGTAMEAQQWLSAQLEKSYDPSAEYSFNFPRLVVNMAGGGFLGMAHPLTKAATAVPGERANIGGTEVAVPAREGGVPGGGAPPSAPEGGTPGRGGESRDGGPVAPQKPTGPPLISDSYDPTALQTGYMRNDSGGAYFRNGPDGNRWYYDDDAGEWQFRGAPKGGWATDQTLGGATVDEFTRQRDAARAAGQGQEFLNTLRAAEQAGKGSGNIAVLKGFLRDWWQRTRGTPEKGGAPEREDSGPQPHHPKEVFDRADDISNALYAKGYSAQSIHKNWELILAAAQEVAAGRTVPEAVRAIEDHPSQTLVNEPGAAERQSAELAAEKAPTGSDDEIRQRTADLKVANQRGDAEAIRQRTADLQASLDAATKAAGPTPQTQTGAEAVGGGKPAGVETRPSSDEEDMRALLKQPFKPKTERQPTGAISEAGGPETPQSQKGPETGSSAASETPKTGSSKQNEPTTGQGASTGDGTRIAPITLQTPSDIDRAGAVANPTPTPGQAEAENYQHAHVEIPELGLTGSRSISIETAEGGTRLGPPDETGKPAWMSTLHATYGRIKGTKGADGEPLDIFIGKQPGAGEVYVVDQRDPETGKFDEHKTFAHFPDGLGAVNAYLKSYDTNAIDRIGGMRRFTPQEFQDWLKGDTTKPLLMEGAGAEPAAKPAEEPVKPASAAGAEPGRHDLHQNHLAIEAAIKAQGEDPNGVRPVDIARAAEIMAKEGYGPKDAFQIAFARSMLEDGHLTPERVKELYTTNTDAILRGAHENAAAMEPGQPSGGGLRAPPQGATTGRPAAEAGVGAAAEQRPGGREAGEAAAGHEGGKGARPEPAGHEPHPEGAAGGAGEPVGADQRGPATGTEAASGKRNAGATKAPTGAVKRARAAIEEHLKKNKEPAKAYRPEDLDLAAEMMVDHGLDPDRALEAAAEREYHDEIQSAAASEHGAEVLPIGGEGAPSAEAAPPTGRPHVPVAGAPQREERPQPEPEGGGRGHAAAPAAGSGGAAGPAGQPATGGQPVAGQPAAGGPERITANAVRVGGKVYTGETHGDAYNEALADHGGVDPGSTKADRNLFLTSKGRVVTQKEALEISRSDLGLEPTSATGRPTAGHGGSVAPDVVYHGTPTEVIGDFNRHAGSAAKAGRDTVDTVGVWFTTSQKNAREFGHNVLPAKLTITNPLVVEGWKGLEAIAKANNLERTEGKTRDFYQVSGKKLRAWLEKQGYDGIHMIGGEDAKVGQFDYWIALNPDQIKRLPLAEKTSAGEQHVLPGAEKAPQGAQAQKGAEKPKTVDDLRSAYDKAKTEQGGFSTVYISEIVKNSGLPIAEVQRILKDAAQRGEVSLNRSSAAEATLSPEIKAAAIKFPDDPDHYHTVTFKAKPAEAKKPKPVGPLRTGRPLVDALLAEPEVAAAIANPKINDKNDVPYMAGASNGDDRTTNYDKRLPRTATVSGVTFDPAIPANVHETVEKAAMERLIAQRKKIGLPFPRTEAKQYGQADMPLRRQIVDAYAKAGGGEFNRAIDLTVLRKFLLGLSREAVDAELKRMHIDQDLGANLHHNDNHARLTDADRESAINAFGDAKHKLWISRDPRGTDISDKEMERIYEIAHHEYAEPAEDAWYRARGIDIAEVNKWWAAQDQITEHEDAKDPPANLYRKPYPHQIVEGVKHEESGVAAEWPTTTPVDTGQGAAVPAEEKPKAGPQPLEIIPGDGIEALIFENHDQAMTYNVMFRDKETGNMLPSGYVRVGSLIGARAKALEALQGKRAIPGESPVYGPDVRLAHALLARLRLGKPITNKALQQAATEAHGGKLAEGKFDRKDANDALELAVNMLMKADPQYRVMIVGGGWERAEQQLDRLLGLLPTQTVRSEEQIALQQFSTPPTYALAVAYAAGIRNGDTVLEPSAGTGSIVAAATHPGARIIANELSPRRAELLKALVGDSGVVHTENAEQIDNILKEKPTVVVMNPPFSRSGERMGNKKLIGIGSEHVEAALNLLEPGGRLVAILGRGMAPDANKFKDFWARIGRANTIRANIGVSGEVYKKYGTTFGTRLVVIDKVQPTGQATVVKEVGTVPELMQALEGIRETRPQLRPAEPSRPVLAPGGEGIGAASLSPPAIPGVVGPGTGDRGGLAGSLHGAATTGSPVRVGAGERPQVAAVEPGGAGRPEGQPVAPHPGSLEPASGVGGHPGGDLQPPAVAEPSHPIGSERVDLGHAEPGTQGAAKITDSLYETYEPRKVRIKGAKKHPGPLVESAAMASVDAPDPTYRPALSKDIIDKGMLSLPQLEAVVYAGQAHAKTLPAAEGETGRRRGFFIGDGTGVGKGREIAGIILDNMQQGRTKAVWVSEKRKLLNDAKRDWSGLGQDKNLLFDVGKTKSGEPVKATRGIAFVTYDTLKGGMSDQEKLARTGFAKKQPVIVGNMAGTITKIAKDGTLTVKMEDGTTRDVPSYEAKPNTAEAFNLQSRVDQIVNWVGENFDGVIAFDESHAMGNIVATKGDRGVKEAAQKALAGLKLQERLPNARIVYVSATGATEVSNLGYADRLGLWGRGTAFADRNKFINEVTSGGIAAMELVARDMKNLGLYMARNLSYDDGTPKGRVEYERVLNALDKNQREIYDTSAEAWQIVLQNINAALELTDGSKDSRAKSAAMSAFWGGHQRFFNQIITSLQMPSVIKAAEKDLEAGRQVVLQLTNTNEASQERAAAKAETAEDIEDLDITPRDQIIQLIENSFPTQQYESFIDDSGNEGVRPVVDSEGKPVQNKDALRMKEELIDRLASLRVPQGPLDLILDHFGHEVAAEVTGRGRRFIMKTDEKTGERKRTEESRPASANQNEIDNFQAGKKKILVFSEAGGTGASYHADNGSASKNARRSHYLVQAGWRADKAVQGFGRTHRTNQASAPIFHLVSTDIEGQKRFISSIARRLGQLGALTKGQRQTGDQGIFSSRDNLESTEAKIALRQFFADLINGHVDGIGLDDFERQTGLRLQTKDKDGRVTGITTQLPEITQFLNRLLSMKIDMQNRVFQSFSDRLDSVIEARKEAGLLDVGLETIAAGKIEKQSEQVVHTDKESGAQTKHVRLTVSEKLIPTPFKFVANNPARPVKSWVRSPTGKVYAAADAPHKTEGDSGRIVEQYRLISPVAQSRLIPQESLRGEKWTIIDPGKAREMWDAEIAGAPEFVDRDMHIITGAVLPVWDRLKGSSRIVRLNTDAGERMLGRVIAQKDVAATLKALGADTGAAGKVDPARLFSNLMSGGSAGLANDWRLKRSLVAGEHRIELLGPSSFGEGQEVKKDGVFTERIGYQTRYFIPTDPESGRRVLEKITEYRPVVSMERGDEPDVGFSEGLTPFRPPGFAEGRGADTFVDLGPYVGEDPLGRDIQDYVVGRGRDTGLEHIVVVNQGGDVVLHGRGTEDATGMPPELLKLLHDPSQRLVVHHNHPRNSPLSRVDIAMLGAPGLSAVWAHGHGDEPTGTVSRAELTPAARGALGPDFKTAFLRIREIQKTAVIENLYDPLQEAVLRDDLHAETANNLHAHLGCVALHRAGIVDYDSNIDAGPAIAALNLEPHIQKAAESAARSLFDAEPNRDDRRAGAFRHPGDLGATFGVPQELAARHVLLEGLDFRRGGGDRPQEAARALGFKEPSREDDDLDRALQGVEIGGHPVEPIDLALNPALVDQLPTAAKAAFERSQKAKAETDARIEAIDAELGRELKGVEVGGSPVEVIDAALNRNLRPHLSKKANDLLAERDGLTAPDLGFREEPAPAWQTHRAPDVGLYGELTPLAVAKRAEVETTLRQWLLYLAGPNAKIEFPDRILNENAPGYGDLKFPEGTTGGGGYNPVLWMIRVALGDPKWKDPFSSLSHEAFHWAEDHFATDLEMQVMKREEPELRRHVERRIGAGALASLAGFEVRAIAFQHYMDNRFQGSAPTGIHAGIRRFFERLFDVVKRTKNLLSGLGFRTTKDFFSDIAGGAAARRQDRMLPQPSRLLPELQGQGEAARMLGLPTAPEMRSTLERTASTVKNFWTSNFQPELFSEIALKADPLFARYASMSAQEKDSFVKLVDKDWYYWNRQPLPKRLAFMAAMEGVMGTGHPPLSAGERAMVQFYKAMFDRNFAEEKRMGSKAGYFDDYFPHIWKREDGARRFMEKQTAQVGPTWFQKKRYYDTIQEGMAAGLELRSTNPIDLVSHRLLSGVDMRMRMQLLYDLQTTGQAFKVKGAPPVQARGSATWMKVNAPDREQWVLSPDVQQLWNNAVAPKGFWGLDGWRGGLFRAWMKWKNVWVQAVLAASLFHPVHVLGITFADHMARAWDQAVKGGDLIGATKSFVRGVAVFPTLGIWDAATEGREYKTAWKTRPEHQTPRQRAIIALANEGGVSFQLSEQLRIKAAHDLARAWQDKSLMVIPHGLRRLSEFLMAPIFEKWIPALKSISYIRSAEALLARRPELLNDNTKRRVALRAIGKDVDNRFGEMFYKSLFLNKFLKEGLIASLISLGWQTGLIRMIAGLFNLPLKAAAAVGIYHPSPTRRAIWDARNNTPFIVAYVASSMAFAGAITYMNTGEMPVGNDYIFPRAGGVNPDMTPRRWTTPFYTRELPMLMKHVEEHGGGLLGTVKGTKAMAWNKMAFEPISAIYENKDYWGYQLYNEDADWYKQVYQGLRHVFADMKPIAWIGAQRALDTGGGTKDVVASFMGFGPAPAYAEKTAIQNRIAHLFRDFATPEFKAAEEEENSQAKMRVRSRILQAKQTGDQAALEVARAEGHKLGMKTEAMNKIGKEPSDVYMFSRLPEQKQIDVLHMASPEEYQRYFRHASAKTKSAMKNEESKK